MKIYKVAIMETRRKAVSVRAESKDDAEQRVLDGWKNTEIILDEIDDFDSVTAEALDEGIEDDGSISYDTVIGGYGYEKPENA